MAHEVIHEIHRTGSSGLVLKLDYEKAYDKVNWDFLVEMLRSRGFGNKWIGWVCSCLHQGTFSIRINDTISPHFVGGKGLKQGDPHSPLLFNLAVDALVGILDKAKSASHLKGVVTHLIPDGGGYSFTVCG